MLVGLIVAIPVVVLALIFVPKLVNILAVVAGVVWFLLQVLLLCRSRTLSLVMVIRFYSMGAAFAIPIGLTAVVLRGLFGWKEYGEEASVYLAGPLEEVGKLVTYWD